MDTKLRAVEQPETMKPEDLQKLANRYHQVRDQFETILQAWGSKSPEEAEINTKSKDITSDL